MLFIALFIPKHRGFNCNNLVAPRGHKFADAGDTYGIAGTRHISFQSGGAIPPLRSNTHNSMPWTSLLSIRDTTYD
jgi:hypothetical protein